MQRSIAISWANINQLDIISNNINNIDYLSENIEQILMNWAKISENIDISLANIIE